ncbi:hypothetical protein NEFER03_0655 [Nematocida sp. LUAm3]|nr:hypothetical protein NEFER03_0655 [Nematocida sp. LUAm3]KAI5175114.1 hypothetical protein NEFER02_1075 [Nematocida sp. LUAm2]KAI5179434.1 hypothetical protein NEFER01_2250 [Nematocida sp. LUAm1]
MYDTISYDCGRILVLEEKGISIVNGETTRINTSSRPILVCGKYVATEDKKVFLLQNSELVEVGELERKPTSMCIERNKENEKEVLYVADRLGAVYRREEKGFSLIFGSISMITDINVLGKYLVTSDKDNKIRITRRVAPYSIEEFVLMHGKPLLSTVILDEKYIISGGYDEYLSVYRTDEKDKWIYAIREEKMEKYMCSSLPGIENTSAISNIEISSEPYIYKLLLSKDFLLVIRKTHFILLKISREEKSISFSPISLSSFSNVSTVDGLSLPEENKFFLITKEGDLLLVSEKGVSKQQRISNYCPPQEEDLSLVSKQYK